MKKIISLVLCVLLCALTFTACGGKTEGKSEDASDSAKLTGHPQVEVTMENGGKFVIELYPEYAPETCANFVNLVKSHFYDGLTFHRVVDGFMAQGGSTDGQGNKGSDKTIKGEFASNGFTQNTLNMNAELFPWRVPITPIPRHLSFSFAMMRRISLTAAMRRSEKL